MAYYPTAIPNTTNYPDQTDDVDWIYSSLYNNMRNEVLAICLELGASPSGGSADLATRLNLLALKTNVLELDNTDSFTPDADYEPATKKYHDDNSIASVAADTSPELGGEMDCGEHSIGFTEKANVSSGNAVTIDWRASNKQKLTLTENTTLSFIAPSNPCTLTLRVIQSGAGNTITFPTIKTAGGAGLANSETDGAIDIFALYYDGTNYYGISSLLFS